MNKKEAQGKITFLLSSGVGKAEVFKQLSGQGVNDRYLANFIASYADPRRCEENKGLIKFLLVITYLQVIIGFISGFAIGMQIGPNAKWIAAFFIAAFVLIFAWGFHKNKAGAYNAYILLSIVQFPRQIEGFAKNPAAGGVGIVIGILLIGYVWYVRKQLFPDFAFIGPLKVKGQYIFSS
jgi:hypothetical protein